jgi:uncharacterized protein (UPF0332 family)
MLSKKFLEVYIKKGLIKKLDPDFHTIQTLVFRAQQDLKTARANLTIDEGIAYTVAYLAMLHAGRALMLSKGYRPADGFQHKTVVEFMEHVLGKDCIVLVEKFDRMRKNRNLFTYEVTLTISKTEAENALKTAIQFVSLIQDIIKQKNPQTEFTF